MILPMVKYLQAHDVSFHYGLKVDNVLFDCRDGKKITDMKLGFFESLALKEVLKKSKGGY